MADFVITNAPLLDPAAGEIRPGASVREADRIVELGEDGAAVLRARVQPYADLLLVDGDPLGDISVRDFGPRRS